MGFMDKSVSVEDFENFKSEILGKINVLATEIDLKATDSEIDAKNAAVSAQNVEKGIRDTKSVIDETMKELLDFRGQAKVELDAIKSAAKAVEKLKDTANTASTDSEEIHNKIVDLHQSATSAHSTITQELTKLNAAVKEAESLPTNVASVEKLLETTSAVAQNIDGLLSHSMKKKADIDEIHKSVLGVNLKAANGTVERIDGLVDELKVSYDEIASELETLDRRIEELVGEILEAHDRNLSEDRAVFEKLMKTSSDRYSAINQEITSLLPGAMAAGLSAAYEKKTSEELVSLTKYDNNFKVAIGLMVAVSLIPFSVDVYLLGWQNAGLVEVIKNTPSLIISILPLYFPILWFAYSSSKKLNLSKRLIEEYTHKAVLGKTFSGLSNQIESLPRESEVRDDLRTRLLFNLLQVSSENPGKLITDYNKSDHPLMDALENSAKLSDSVETLAKLPGFSALAKKLSAKTDEMLENQKNKVAQGLAANEAITASDNK